MPIPRSCLVLASAILLAGCVREAEPEPVGRIVTQATISPEEGGAVSRAPMPAPPPPAN